MLHVSNSKSTSPCIYIHLALSNSIVLTGCLARWSILGQRDPANVSFRPQKSSLSLEAIWKMDICYTLLCQRNSFADGAVPDCSQQPYELIGNRHSQVIGVCSSAGSAHQAKGYCSNRGEDCRGTHVESLDVCREFVWRGVNIVGNLLRQASRCLGMKVIACVVSLGFHDQR